MATALQTVFPSAGVIEEPTPADMVRVLIRGGMAPTELAASCGVSERTVYNWLARGGHNPSRRHTRLIRHLYDRFERGKPRA